MNTTPKKTRHYLALDGLRGVAALTVVGLHLTNYFQLHLRFAHAYLAVDFFFMLSGFVIAFAYDRRLQNGMSTGLFFVIRLIRLYPAVILGIAIGTAALLGRAHFAHDVTVSSVLRAAATNMFLLPTPSMLYVRPWAFPIDGPLWSLSIEMAINLIYAALFKFLTKSTLWVALMAGAVLTSLTAYHYGALDIGFRWSDFYFGGIRILFPFVAGVLLCRLLQNRVARSSWGHIAFLPLFVILAAPKFLGGIYDAFAVVVAFPLILMLASHAVPHPKIDTVWRALGDLSYPLYVIHYPFVIVASNLAHQRHLTGTALIVAALITFGGILLVSSVALACYDVPVRRFLTVRLNRRLLFSAVHATNQN